MAKGRYTIKSVEEFDWKTFQKHMGYDDEELEKCRADPLKNRYVTTGATEGWNKTWMICECIESHGCESGLEVGDRLYFSAFGSVLESKLSDNWCVHCLHSLGWYVRGFRNLYSNGKDPNNMYVLFGGCPDNTQFGLGRVIYQLYFVPEKDVHNPKLHRPARQGERYYIAE